MTYFDYETVATEAKLTPRELEQLREKVRLDFPNDPMMVDLHLLRACKSIRDGRVTLAEAIGNPRAA